MQEDGLQISQKKDFKKSGIHGNQINSKQCI